MTRWLRWTAAVIVAVPVMAFVAVQCWFAWSIVPADPFVPRAHEREQLAFFRQSDRWAAAHLQGPHEVGDGQALDPRLQYIAEQSRPAAAWTMRLAPAIFATPWGRASVRNRVDRDWQLYAAPFAPMARVEDRKIAGRGGNVIPIRIYRPKIAGPLPILVYHHGGGWVFGSIASTDRVARLIANEARVIVVSVGYRLAPEHRYPAASDDGEEAFLWVRAHADALGGDPARVGVGGDSAGGHVAINIAQRQRAAGRPMPAAMLLYYPGAGLPQHDRSYRLFGTGYLLDAAFIEFILPRVFADYRPGAPIPADAFMDPAGKADLTGMPPTVVATAGFDILRDSGRRFAMRLKAAGVPVRYANYGSLTHSFLQFSGIVPDAWRATALPARAFGEAVRIAVPPETILALEKE